MLLERIYDEDLAQASYLIGCQASGEALVIDPRRDLGEVLSRAQAHGLRIVAVTETHIHADYLAGTRELAAATGATVYVSDEGGPDWTYGPEFDGAVRMKDGHCIRIGNLTVEAVHTPGHTPGSVCLLCGELLFSGDTLFAGSCGRTDFPGGSMQQMQQSLSLLAELPIPDTVQVLPGHESFSTLGRERRSNPYMNGAWF